MNFKPCLILIVILLMPLGIIAQEADLPSETSANPTDTTQVQAEDANVQPQTQTPPQGETQTPPQGETQTPPQGETQTPPQGETQTANDNSQSQENAVKPPLQEMPPIQGYKIKKYVAPLSGIVLTPTAYKGIDSDEIGPALDINAVYYIGRIYGKNKYDWTLNEKNYLDRIGLWILDLDGKLVVQSENRWRPAMAVGVQAALIFRDSPQPQLDDQTVTADVDKSDKIASVFVVLTKKLSRKFILNAGYSEGNFSNFIPQLSEFLTPQAIALSSKTGTATSRHMLFGGLIFLLKPNYPISIEILVPQGAAQNPKLINFRFSRLVKLNFQLSYLTYDGGWDLLGCFQFRFNMFPKQ